MDYEAATRSRQIDVQLRAAGWMTARQRTIEEFVVTSSSPQDTSDFADYALIDDAQEPIAIVEAKRSSRSALAGERQAADYADRILQQRNVDPFIFLANGNEIWFHDRSRDPVRKVSGFFTQDDLERLRFLRKYHQPTAEFDVNQKIAGRGYQIEAIRTIAGRRSPLRRTACTRCRAQLANYVSDRHRCRADSGSLFEEDPEDPGRDHRAVPAADKTIRRGSQSGKEANREVRTGG
jgi:type I restriction enzyme, R subunit